MKLKRQIIVATGALVCLFAFGGALVQADDYAKLEKVLDKVDQPQDWPAMPNQQYARPGQAPPATPTPQAFSPFASSYMQRGMPYSSESIAALKNSAVWKYMTKPGAAGAMAGQAGGNPFNLSPFGMLHYMWDDTNYVSDANPVTLYQTQSELQTAQRYSQLAQAASSRGRYARNPQEREAAAQQARYYAGLAKQAAQQAQQVSQAGSLNPAEVAQAAVQQANAAQSYASQASNYARRGF